MTDVDQFSSSTAIDQESITKTPNGALQVSRPSKILFGNFEGQKAPFSVTNTSIDSRSSYQFTNELHSNISTLPPNIRGSEALYSEVSTQGGDYYYSGTVEFEANISKDVDKVKIPVQAVSQRDGYGSYSSYEIIVNGTQVAFDDQGNDLNTIIEEPITSDSVTIKVKITSNLENSNSTSKTAKVIFDEIIGVLNQTETVIDGVNQ